MAAHPDPPGTSYLVDAYGRDDAASRRGSRCREELPEL
jgi:hypothetical protein